MLTQEENTLEDLALLLINPIVFFTTAYFLLNPDHHDWMGVLAVGMALLYAVLAKLLLEKSRTPRVELLAMIGLALTFVTLAIPIQLKSNWITIAWAVEGLALLWAGIEVKRERWSRKRSKTTGTNSGWGRWPFPYCGRSTPQYLPRSASFAGLQSYVG
jgi:uncharacterized membrane protein SirB2